MDLKLPIEQVSFSQSGELLGISLGRFDCGIPPLVFSVTQEKIIVNELGKYGAKSLAWGQKGETGERLALGYHEGVISLWEIASENGRTR